MADGEGSVDVDGRTLVYVQVGDPTGPLVLHNHGGPSSRLEARVFEAAATALGLRSYASTAPVREGRIRSRAGPSPAGQLTWRRWPTRSAPRRSP